MKSERKPRFCSHVSMNTVLASDTQMTSKSCGGHDIRKCSRAGMPGHGGRRSMVLRTVDGATPCSERYVRTRCMYSLYLPGLYVSLSQEGREPPGATVTMASSLHSSTSVSSKSKKIRKRRSFGGRACALLPCRCVSSITPGG